MGPGTHLPFLGWLLPLVRACSHLVTPLKPCLLHALLLRLLRGLPQLTPITSRLSGSLLNPLLSSTPSSLAKHGYSCPACILQAPAPLRHAPFHHPICAPTCMKASKNLGKHPLPSSMRYSVVCSSLVLNCHPPHPTRSHLLPPLGSLTHW